MSIPKIIHQIHLGDPLSPEAEAMIQTLGDMNPGFEHILWTAQDLARIGLDVKSLEGLYPAYAGISNALRIHLIAIYGGIYADTDIECLKPLDPLVQHKAFGAIQDDQGRICNAFFGATPNHPWITWQRDRMEDYKGHCAAWGVELMTAAPRDGVTLINPNLCYPWKWDDPPDRHIPHPDSLVLHHWAGSWLK